MIVLNVAEKNDAAKTISGILGSGRVSNNPGVSVYNRNYEFPYQLYDRRTNQRSQVSMVFTSVTGHLMTVEFSERCHKNWNSCSPKDLFEAPVRRFVPEDMKNVAKNLENLSRRAGMLILWTDCDREGENIGFEVLHVCRNVKPSLPVKRAKFSEMTTAAIKRAIDNLEEPNENLSEAVECRRELDLRIGAAFTRFQTLRLQKTYPSELSHLVVSFGPCQFPTLGFVVDRWRDRNEFVQEPFWKVKMTHKSAPGVSQKDSFDVEFTWARVRLFDEDFVNVICDDCRDANLATVSKVEHRQRQKWRPVALDTVELEKAASRWLRITAKETMQIAEKLYVSGLISYPRTETNIFPPKLDLKHLVEQQFADPRWGSFAQGVMNQGPMPRNGNKTDNAHPPIHPTKYKSDLSGNESRVYEFIVRHFLACVSRDAIGQECKVETKIASETFHANGLSISQRNYLDVYPYHFWGDKNLPCYQMGQQFVPSSLEVVGGTTMPPNLLTESDLIGLMEKHGIGTDATHAEHIEKIKNREYSALVNRTFHPSSLGIGLVEGYELIGHRMSKPQLRAEMEVDFAAICDGLKTRQQVLQDQLRRYSSAFTALERDCAKLERSLAKYFSQNSNNSSNVSSQIENGDANASSNSTVMKCRLCESLMTLRQNRRRSLSASQSETFSIKWEIVCESYPNCKATLNLPNFVLSAEVSRTTCSRCANRSQTSATDLQNSDTALPKLIDFRFKPGSIPPFFGVEYTGCVAGCNNDLLSLFREAGSSFTNSSRFLNSTTSSQRSTSFSSANSSISNSSSIHSQGPRGSRIRGASQHGRPSSTVRGSNNSSRGTRVQSSSNHRGQRSFNEHRGHSTGQRGVGRGFNRRNSSGSNNSSGIHLPPSRSFSNSSDNNSSGPNVSCSCNQLVVSRTVRKEGPNQGRQFYSCATRGCNFFLWAPDASS